MTAAPGLVTAKRGQGAQGGQVFGALCDQAQAEAVRKVDDRGGALVGEQAGEKRPVLLQLVGGQGVEVSERGIAGSVVVDADADPAGGAQPSVRAPR